MKGEELREVAEVLAQEIVGHIDTMYPGMWVGVTKNARRSLRGCVVNEVTAKLKDWAFVPEGSVVVPLEPTPQMIEAGAGFASPYGQICIGDEIAAEAWRAMCIAASTGG